MLITLVVIVVFVGILLDFSFKKKLSSVVGNMPGPAVIPIIGSTLVLQTANRSNFLNFLVALNTKYGNIGRGWIFNRMIVVIRKPELVETVLSNLKHTTKNFFYDFLGAALGNGLVISNGSKWFTRRKIITPTFHFKVLERFVGAFNKHSSVLVKQLENHLDGKVFNVHSYISLAALDIICETAMGTTINAQTDAYNAFALAVIDLTNVMMERVSNFWYHVDLIYNIFGSDLKKRHTRALNVTKKFTERIINERRKLITPDSITNRDNFEDDVGAKKKLALLDVLLQATINGVPLSNADIQEEVTTFLGAGIDSVTSGTSFTLFLLSRHPKIQSRVYQEICEVIGSDKDKEVTFNDLQNLKYLECVIKESLRLYPVVPVIARLITEDSQVGEYTLPAGTSVAIPIFLMMQDPQIFPEPEIFKPERHFTESINDDMHPYSFIPFSAGPRNCIGQKFAMLDMKSIVSKVLRHYEVLPLGSDPIPIMNIFLQSKNGVDLGIKLR